MVFCSPVVCNWHYWKLLKKKNHKTCLPLNGKHRTPQYSHPEIKRLLGNNACIRTFVYIICERTVTYANFFFFNLDGRNAICIRFPGLGFLQIEIEVCLFVFRGAWRTSMKGFTFCATARTCRQEWSVQYTNLQL